MTFADGSTPVERWLAGTVLNVGSPLCARVAADICPKDRDADVSAPVRVNLYATATALGRKAPDVRAALERMVRLGALRWDGVDYRMVADWWEGRADLPVRAKAKASACTEIPPALTHAELVGRAARWLAGKHGCGVVLTEFVTSLFEVPDAIGWRSGGAWSVLVECKVSRGDFTADRYKSHRDPRAVALGQERWFLAPPGVVRAEDVPLGWGLAVADARRVRVIVPAPVSAARNPAITAHEMPLLYSVARRCMESLGVEIIQRRALLCEDGE